MVRCAQARNLSDQILADLAQVCVVCVNELKTFSYCACLKVKKVKKLYKKKAYTLKNISRCAGLKVKKFYKKKAYTLKNIFPLRGLKS